MVQQFLNKGITEREIRELIRCRDGNITCSMGATSFLEQERGYARTEKTAVDDLPMVEIDGNEMTTTEAYCRERYNDLKKKVCDKIGAPYYVQLNLEWMLFTYFHQRGDE